MKCSRCNALVPEDLTQCACGEYVHRTPYPTYEAALMAEVSHLRANNDRLAYENRRLRAILYDLAHEFHAQNYPEPRTGLILECIDALGLDGWKR